MSNQILQLEEPDATTSSKKYAAIMPGISAATFRWERGSVMTFQIFRDDYYGPIIRTGNLLILVGETTLCAGRTANSIVHLGKCLEVGTAAYKLVKTYLYLQRLIHVCDFLGSRA